MKLFRKRDFITVGFILIFSAAAVYMFYVILKPIELLPIYQPAEVNEKLVDSSIIHVAKYHKISRSIPLMLAIWKLQIQLWKFQNKAKVKNNHY